MSNLFEIKWKDVAGAIVSGVIIAVLGYLSNITNIADINVHQIASISILAAVTSLLKALSTDEQGRLLGGIKVK
jgi:hypothetical protein